MRSSPNHRVRSPLWTVSCAARSSVNGAVCPSPPTLFDVVVHRLAALSRRVPFQRRPVPEGYAPGCSFPEAPASTRALSHAGSTFLTPNPRPRPGREALTRSPAIARATAQLSAADAPTGAPPHPVLRGAPLFLARSELVRRPVLPTAPRTWASSSAAVLRRTKATSLAVLDPLETRSRAEKYIRTQGASDCRVKAGGCLKADTSRPRCRCSGRHAEPSAARLLLGVERSSLDRAHVLWTPHSREEVAHQK